MSLPLAKLASKLRSMKKGKLLLGDFCCGPTSAPYDSISAGCSDERPMMSPLNVWSSSSSSSNVTTSTSSGSSCSSSCSAGRGLDQPQWRNRGPVATPAAGPRKRIMVVVDDSREAKTALLWTLSHVAQRLDIVTLLHVIHSKPSYCFDSEDSRAMESEKTRLRSEDKALELISSLKSLCAMRQPEVEVEVVVVVGDKGPSIVRQAKKLEASVLVLGHQKPKLWQRCLRWNKDDQLVDYCIQHADCLTLSVRRKSKHSGYLISSKWQKNFWLLA